MRNPFCKYGVWFYYKGDEVLWVWPWKRRSDGCPFFSISFEAAFKSLKELDKCWNEYCKAVGDKDARL